MNSDVINIKVEYKDGTVKDIKKGIAAEFECDIMHMDMLEFAKFDLVRLTYGMISTLEQMGLTEALMAFIHGQPLPDEGEYPAEED